MTISTCNFVEIRRDKKKKNLYQKTLFIFLSNRKQNIIADCCTRLYYTMFFHVCGCQTSRVQIPESELHCYMNTLSSLCFIYFKQSGNHANGSLLIGEAPLTMIWNNNKHAGKCHSTSLCSVMRSRLYCLQLWKLNKGIYSTAVVLIEN